MTQSRVFRGATTSARLLVGTIVSIAAVVAVVTAVSLPWPTVAREPASVTVVPAPAAAVVACTGGLVALGRDLDAPGVLSVAAAQNVVSGVEQGAAPPQSTLLSVPELSDVEGPVAFTAAPHDDARTDIAAAGAVSVSDDDLIGYAASACRPPLMESWLVGGSASTGTADFVLLANPGTVAATVQLTVFGATGATNPPGGADLVVAPGSQRIVPLAGLALGEGSPVIRVTSAGAPVQAALQASITRTLLPGGVDQVGALGSLAQSQVIAGVDVTEPPGEEGAVGAATLARILSPSVDSAAVVTVQRIGASTPVRDPLTVPLVAGIPTDMDLGRLDPGSYVVSIEAESPVAAAVWQTTGFGEGADFAWYTPSPLIEEPTVVVAPLGPRAQLTVTNPTDEALTATLTALEAGTTLEIAIEPGAAATAVLQPRAVYELTPPAGIHAALSFAGVGELAGFPVWPADAAAPAMTIYP